MDTYKVRELICVFLGLVFIPINICDKVFRKDSCNAGKFCKSTTPDNKLDKVMITLTKASKLACLDECLKNEFCFSINWNSADGTCELNSSTMELHPTSYIPAAGFLYYGGDLCGEDLLGYCTTPPTIPWCVLPDKVGDQCLVCTPSGAGTIAKSVAETAICSGLNLISFPTAASYQAIVEHLSGHATCGAATKFWTSLNHDGSNWGWSDGTSTFMKWKSPDDGTDMSRTCGYLDVTVPDGFTQIDCTDAATVEYVICEQLPPP